MSSDKEPLPPIPDESFDGEKSFTEIKFEKCLHKMIEYAHGELRCPCGVAYSGPNLHTLYTALRNQ